MPKTGNNGDKTSKKKISDLPSEISPNLFGFFVRHEGKNEPGNPSNGKKGSEIDSRKIESHAPIETFSASFFRTFDLGALLTSREPLQAVVGNNYPRLRTSLRRPGYLLAERLIFKPNFFTAARPQIIIAEMPKNYRRYLDHFPYVLLTLSLPLPAFSCVGVDSPAVLSGSECLPLGLGALFVFFAGLTPKDWLAASSILVLICSNFSFFRFSFIRLANAAWPGVFGSLASLAAFLILYKLKIIYEFKVGSFVWLSAVAFNSYFREGREKVECA